MINILPEDNKKPKKMIKVQNKEFFELLNIDKSILRDHVIICLLNGQELPSSLKNAISYENFGLYGGPVQAAILEIIDCDNNIHTPDRIDKRRIILKAVYEDIYYCIEQFKTIRNHTVIGDMGYMKIILQPQCISQSDIFCSQTSELFNYLIKDIRQKFPVKVTIGAGNIYNRLCDANLSYLDAKDALNHKYLLGENRVIYYNQYNYSFDCCFIIPFEKEQLLASCIMDGNNECYNVIDDIFNYICQSGRTDFYNIFTALNYLLTNIAIQFGSKYLSLNKICNISEYTEMRFENCNNIEEIKIRFVNTITGLLQAVITYHLVHSNNIIRSVCEYILQNVDSNIQLKSISNQFYISTNYFSYLFKEQTNENFQGYLSRVKMDRAKFLLKNSNCKAYEIGNMLGYHEPAYFSKLFRKYTGCTPTEYRKQ